MLLALFSGVAVLLRQSLTTKFSVAWNLLWSSKARPSFLSLPGTEISQNTLPFRRMYIYKKSPSTGNWMQGFHTELQPQPCISHFEMLLLSSPDWAWTCHLLPGLPGVGITGMLSISPALTQLIINSLGRKRGWDSLSRLRSKESNQNCSAKKDGAWGATWGAAWGAGWGAGGSLRRQRTT